MKALKNESTTYIEQIASAVQSCYAQNTEPGNAQLTALYSTIGQCICQQGEKAFVAHLAKLLAEQLPQPGGFSMRNLRRMRDFYRTYENQPELMHKAQTLGWTQNAVILDCCDTDAQRSFYMELAAEKKLSKLALMRAIESREFEIAQSEKSAADACPDCCPVVGEVDTTEAGDITDAAQTQCGAFVTACEPSRQGDTLQIRREAHKTINYGEVFGNAVNPTHMTPLKCVKPLISATQKAIKRLLKMSAYFHQTELRRRLLERPPKGQPPPLVSFT